MTNRTAFVTGASRGIGRAIALALGKAGCLLSKLGRLTLARAAGFLSACMLAAGLPSAGFLAARVRTAGILSAFLSGGLLGAGGGLAVAGIVSVIVGYSGKEKKPEGKKLSLAPLVGPGRLGVTGEF